MANGEKRPRNSGPCGVRMLNSPCAPRHSAPPTVGNEMFLHNMRALWREDPALALRVDAIPDDERIPLEPTRSGAWTVRMASDLPPQSIRPGG